MSNEYWNHIVKFFVNIINMVMEKFNLWSMWRRSDPPLPTNAAEGGGISRIEGGEITEEWFQWLIMVIGCCYTIAGATIQALQSAAPLTTASEVVYIALVISFSSFGVSAYLRALYKSASAAAMHVDVLFGSMALLLALVSNLRITFMVTCVAIYFLGFFIIVSANLFKCFSGQS